MKNWYLEDGKLSRLCETDTEKVVMHTWVGLNTQKEAYVHNKADYGIGYDKVLGEIPTSLTLMDIESDILRTLDNLKVIGVDFEISGKLLKTFVSIETEDGPTQVEGVQILT